MSRPLSDPRLPLVVALRQTAARLQSGADFRWTHMGACVLGHLTQTVTHKTAAEIHRIALEKRGDWAEQAQDTLGIERCPSSGYAMDHVLATLEGLGLTAADIAHLERLSDPAVLRRFPLDARHLDHRVRDDVVRYLEAYAALLEDASVTAA